MVFSSEIFLFLFLPLFMAGYYLTPVAHRSWAILVGSYVFYGWWRLDFLLLLAGTTIFAFVIGNQIARRDGKSAKRFLFLGVAGCLFVLGTFKYLNFFIDSLVALVGKTPQEVGVHWHIILPIGISFYIFQAISYLVDVYRKDAEPAENFTDFAAYIALFPQLIAGPILRYKDLAAQFRTRDHSLDGFNAGLCRFLIGLGKKVILADSIAPLVDAGFNSGAPTATLAWAAAIAFAFQLYFDFSGYSDMAIGLGRMMGFRFAENFRHPYASRSITEFWRRWHISLSTWLRDYLYIPLGGNKRGRARTYDNLMLVMVLGGLWHGANWTFLLWGLWHGGLLAIERATDWIRRIEPVAGIVTFALVVIGWVVFRAENLSVALNLYHGMLGGNGWLPTPAESFVISRESILFTGIAALVVYLEPQLNTLRNAFTPRPGAMRQIAMPFAQIGTQASVILIGGAAVLKLAEQSFSPFLYFQF